MNNSSRKAIKSFLEQYRLKLSWRVLEVGSRDVNGSVRGMFAGVAEYVGCDIEPGPGVDVVVEADKSLWYHFDHTYDVILCCDVLEHARDPWSLMGHMADCMSRDGYLIAVAPFSWPEHRHPIDCYRFAPDGLRHMAEEVGLRVLDCYMTPERGLPRVCTIRAWLQWFHARLWLYPLQMMRGQWTGLIETVLIAQKP